MTLCESRCNVSGATVSFPEDGEPVRTRCGDPQARWRRCPRRFFRSAWGDTTVIRTTWD